AAERAPALPRSCALLRARELAEELAVQAAEAAVAHDEHVIAGARARGEVARERVDVIAHLGARAERARHVAHVPAEIVGRRAPNPRRGRARRGPGPAARPPP